MKTHYSILELLEMKLENLPTTKMGLGSKVVRESWPFIEVAGKGGKGGKRREYAPPPEVLKLIQAKKLNEVLGGLSDLPSPQPSPQPSPTGRGGDAAGLPSPDVRGGELAIGVTDGSTEQQRLCESARRGVLSAVERVMAESGVSKEAAMTTVLTQAKMPGFEHIAKLFSLAADGRGGGGKLPSVRTIKRWFAARESNSLAPKSRTEDMNVPSWLPVFLECYRLPMKPSVSEAYRLFVKRLEACNTDVLYLFITHRATSTNPAGEMAAARLYAPVALRKKGFIYAAQFITRYAQPYLIAKIQANSNDDHDSFMSRFYRFVSGGALSIEREDDVMMLQNSADGQAFRRLENLANARIQKTLLGKVKTSDLETASRASQETEENNRDERIGAYLALLSRAAQHFIDALVMVNNAYGKPINAPKGVWFEFEDEIKVDKTRAERDKMYMDTGQLVLRPELLATLTMS